jgi:hypothetical protein
VGWGWGVSVNLGGPLGGGRNRPPPPPIHTGLWTEQLRKSTAPY